MRIFAWHVHGSWMTAFVQGAHEYVVPVLPDRSANGRGRAQTWEWPASVRELPPKDLAALDVDVVVIQRPEELSLATAWLGRRPGIDVPAVYVEHNAPPGPVQEMRHPVADRPHMTLVHVTHWNRVHWDAGGARTLVIEHGIVDPGPAYRGDLERSAVVINEPARRGRVTGTDLLPRFEKVAPLDLFGIGAGALGGVENLPQAELHRALAERRLYLHLCRWTSLGLSLIEAMQLAMPVVALATTEVPRAVPPEAGVVSNDLEELEEAVRWLLREPQRARAMGAAAREAALARYGLGRFLADWDALLAEVAA
ncbi:MAG: glycosyl transferase [Proteobacteria bacterium]|nr:MAG: glycosyl transferase [Pseudomonadota bacterium]